MDMLGDMLLGKTGPRGGHHPGILESAARNARAFHWFTSWPGDFPGSFGRYLRRPQAVSTGRSGHFV